MFRLARLWRNLVHRDTVERELDAEMRALHDLVADEKARAGSTRDEAQRAAAAEVGHIEAVKAHVRDVRAGAVIERCARDVTVAARMLRRSPVFTSAAVLALALGVGTVTTAFSVVDAELWKPLPFPDAGELVAVRTVGPDGWDRRVAGTELAHWREASHAFADIAGYRWASRRVLQRTSAESVQVASVTANFFATLGLQPGIGRTFGPRDRYGTSTAILSDAGWTRLFARDPAALGRTISLDGSVATIVGIVTESRLARLVSADVFLPIDEGEEAFRDASNDDITVVARLRPGVAGAAAAAELSALSASAETSGAARSSSPAADGRAFTVRVWPLHEFVNGNNWRPLYFFLGAALAVLLLSSISVANLLLARALRRQREFAIRGALGGGRRALVRQLLVEGALLAAPAGAAGLLLAWWALAVVSANVPPEYLQHEGGIPLDVRACAFTLAVTALTTVVFGLVPSLFAARLGHGTALAQGGRTAGLAPGPARWRHAILTAQIAVTLVLLVGAALFLQSFAALKQVPLGFEPHDRLSLRVVLSGPRYEGDAPIRRYADALLERARTVPGVGNAAVASSSPLGSGPVIRFTLPDQAPPAAGEMPDAILRVVSPDYFHVLGIPLRAGRAFTRTDAEGAPRVAIVNEYLADRLFAGRTPIGRTLEIAGEQRAAWTRRPGRVVIVGVASNAREVGINEVGFSDVYLPFAQAPSASVELIAQTTVPVDTVAPSLRQAAGGIDRTIPVMSLSTLAERVDSAFGADRFNLILIATFAAIALLLAAVGIYGVMTYVVDERTRELGVRLALGARPRRLVLDAVWQSARLGVVGGAIGLCLALAAARALGDALYLVQGSHNGLLYGVTTTDPRALAIAYVAIVVVAALAGLAPARRVSGADPLIALRND